MKTEAELKADKKYKAKTIKQIGMPLNRKTDSDIIEWLDTKESKLGAIKGAIRDKIKIEGERQMEREKWRINQINGNNNLIKKGKIQRIEKFIESCVQTGISAEDLADHLIWLANDPYPEYRVSRYLVLDGVKKTIYHGISLYNPKTDWRTEVFDEETGENYPLSATMETDEEDPDYGHKICNRYCFIDGNQLK